MDVSGSPFELDPQLLHEGIHHPVASRLIDAPDCGDDLIPALNSMLVAHEKGQKLKLFYGDEEVIINKGESFYIKTNKKHYIKNIGQTDATVIWVSCPPNF